MNLFRYLENLTNLNANPFLTPAGAVANFFQAPAI